jgi:UDP-2,3-diacylglucosamine hydrolase
MLLGLERERSPIYFVSDAHLGVPIGPADREERLVDKLRGLAGRAGGLFVLGDLFGFWFEYRHAIPKGTIRIVRALSEVVESGIPVIYLGGNHDFWVGSFLRDEVGVRVFDEPITTVLQGRTVHLAHGDGLGPGDSGYKVLKRILRHPLAIAGYRALHPDLGIPLAHRLSSFSRKYTEAREVLLPKILRDVAAPRLGGETSAMVMGHIHYPAHYRGEGLDFLIIGDWVESFTYVRMEGGEFHLRRRDGGEDVAVEAEPFPPRWRAGPGGSARGS